MWDYICVLVGMRCVAMISWLYNIVSNHEQWICMKKWTRRWIFFGQTSLVCRRCATVFILFIKIIFFKSFTAIISDVSEIRTVFTFFFPLCSHTVISLYCSVVLSDSSPQFERNFAIILGGKKIKYFIWCFRFSTRFPIQYFFGVKREKMVRGAKISPVIMRLIVAHINWMWRMKKQKQIETMKCCYQWKFISPKLNTRVNQLSA